MAAGNQHHLEFGGSPVGTEFPGKIQFRLADRIPVLAVSHTFDEETARAIRYNLVATVGPERPYYHRYHFVVLDVRMISEWLPGAGEFVNALRQRMRSIGGELFVVSTVEIPVSGDVPRFETLEDAIAAAKEMRAAKRAAGLRGAL
ncbi:MAG: hypothetical protein ACK47B_25500 [Armatimonadota bacterium]